MEGLTLSSSGNGQQAKTGLLIFPRKVYIMKLFITATFCYIFFSCQIVAQPKVEQLTSEYRDIETFLYSPSQKSRDKLALSRERLSTKPFEELVVHCKSIIRQIVQESLKNEGLAKDAEAALRDMQFGKTRERYQSRIIDEHTAPVCRRKTFSNGNGILCVYSIAGQGVHLYGSQFVDLWTSNGLTWELKESIAIEKPRSSIKSAVLDSNVRNQVLFAVWGHIHGSSSGIRWMKLYTSDGISIEEVDEAEDGSLQSKIEPIPPGERVASFTAADLYDVAGD
jgi:hypothetical protein